jgi:hypothetical protein
MTEDEAVKYYEEILANAKAIKKESAGYYLEGEACEWIASARVALDLVFPSKHVLRVSFDDVLEQGREKWSQYGHVWVLESAIGVFRSALGFLKSGKHRSLIEGAKAETVDELLDQAGLLLSDNYMVAAAVIAGGALETHLAHYCQANGITLNVNPTIGNYNSAIGQARNQGKTVYATADTGLVNGWGGIRNEAAHTPAVFKRTPEEVRLMIEGIRQFLARTS